MHCDFENNILKVLHKQKPAQPTLFELFFDPVAEEGLTGIKLDPADEFSALRRRIKFCYQAGYDYVPIIPSMFCFKLPEHQSKESYSLNEGSLIYDRNSFDEYEWKEPENYKIDALDILSKELPDGMKFIGYGFGGLLEMVIAICGYENLCYMLADDRELVKKIFDNVGKRMVRFYKMFVGHESIGAIFTNDDWGYKNSTMISHEDLRELVFPYHKQIVDMAHGHGKPCGIHTCGNLNGIFEELYTYIGLDAKHSYEDVIRPVESVYDEYHGKIAIVGGIDVDFICRASEADLEKRCEDMLDRAEEFGGYALGSGNTITKYVPLNKYKIMLNTVNRRRGNPLVK